MRCCETVWVDDWHKSQCSRQAVIEHDGKHYCKIHDPEYIKVKNEKANAKFKANSCVKCGHHFKYSFELYCCICGTKQPSAGRS